MEGTDHELGAPFAAGITRTIMNIRGGVLRGKGFEGSILPLGGADWATGVKGTHVSPKCQMILADNSLKALHAYGLMPLWMLMEPVLST